MLPVRHTGTCVISLRSVESEWTGTHVTAVTVRLCKDPHRAQPAGGVLGYREVISISLVKLHSMLPLRWPSRLIHHLCQQRRVAAGSREWGRQWKQIPVLSIRSVYMLYAGCAREPVSFIPFRSLISDLDC